MPDAWNELGFETRDELIVDPITWENVLVTESHCSHRFSYNDAHPSSPTRGTAPHHAAPLAFISQQDGGSAVQGGVSTREHRRAH